MRIPAVLALTIFATSCAALPSAQPSPQARYDQISVTFQSWGRTTAEWRIGRDGTGSFIEDGRSSTLAGAPGDFARIERLLAPAAQWQNRDLPCGPGITDAPYGTIAWTTGQSTARVTWNLGCPTREHRAVLDQIGAATEAARALAAPPPHTP